ncbi:MAG: hypothetical protein IJD94_02450 [Clostridia bacterium]|nr:hypothetical protein [Clostridia bacterium]
MSDFKSLDHLGPIADEMLGGLHADEAMRLRIIRAGEQGGVRRPRRAMRYVPAAGFAALALVCAGAVTARLNTPGDTAVSFVMRNTADAAQTTAVEAAETVQAVEIESIAAGSEVAAGEAMLMADLGDGARVRMGGAPSQSLYAAGEGEAPLVAFEGGVYRMLETPRDIGDALLDGEIASIQLYDEHPSLVSPKEMSMGLSNVAQSGAVIYRIRGLAETTAVACEVEGSMRVFQRASYAGRGPAGNTFEETFSVRGQIAQAELSGVGTLAGEAAEAAIAVLLDGAVLKSADTTAKGKTLTVTLESGLRLQLGVSGDMVSGCGGWSCPEFFEAFESAL